MAPIGTQAWPTRVSASGRTIVDQHGRPWLGVGDTAWSLIGQLDDAQINRYLENRAARGVNLVLVSSPEAYYGDRAPLNIDGVPPFTGQPFRSPLNPAYWARLDRTLDGADSRGITLLICPMYTGWGTDGWAEELRRTPVSEMRRYGDALAARYRDRRNILWLLGHDMPKLGPEIKALGKALADALRASTPHLLAVASHRSRDEELLGIGSEEWAGSGVIPDIDTQYDYSDAPGRNAARLWLLDPARPFLFLEGIYEQEIPGPLKIGDVHLRRQLWGPFANGAAGVIFGNNPVWGLGTKRLSTPYEGTWVENLDGPGSGYLAVFARLTSRIGPAWVDTKVDTAGELVVNPGTGASAVSARYGASLAIIYHPDFSSEPLELRPATLPSASGPPAARLFDPASGAESVIETRRVGERLVLAPPPANTRGDRDWLIVLR